MNNKELIAAAMNARKNSYSPYSKFKVGAALLAVDGEVYLGCNVENASFGATICAERTAMINAVSDGQRAFDKIAIVATTDKASDYTMPCGVCRQVISEFCDKDFEVIIAKSVDDYKVFKLEDLLPHAFCGKSIGG